MKPFVIGPKRKGFNRPVRAAAVVIQFYLVETIGARCLAYRDQMGAWRDAFNNQKLPGFIRVLK